MPDALCVFFGVLGVYGYGDPLYDSAERIGGIVATVFEDPSINPSDVEISRTGSQELVVWGTGFNNITQPVLDFDPPLDSSNLNVKVSSHEGCVLGARFSRTASVVLFDGE